MPLGRTPTWKNKPGSTTPRSGGDHKVATRKLAQLDAAQSFRWTNEGPTDVELLDYH